MESILTFVLLVIIITAFLTPGEYNNRNYEHGLWCGCDRCCRRNRHRNHHLHHTSGWDYFIIFSMGLGFLLWAIIEMEKIK